MLTRGWPLVGWTALALAFVVGAEYAFGPGGEVSVRALIRATARLSLTLFLLAFIARPLRQVWRAPASAWLLANRRQLGVSFTFSHAVHLVFILALFEWSPARLVGEALVAVIVGGIGYVFLFLMAATSFDRTAALLGPTRWRRLHTTGMYYLWMVFFLTLLPLALDRRAYWLMEGPLVAALALRLGVPALARRRLPAHIPSQA